MSCDLICSPVLISDNMWRQLVASRSLRCHASPFLPFPWSSSPRRGEASSASAPVPASSSLTHTSTTSQKEVVTLRHILKQQKELVTGVKRVKVRLTSAASATTTTPAPKHKAAKESARHSPQFAEASRRGIADALIIFARVCADADAPETAVNKLLYYRGQWEKKSYVRSGQPLGDANLYSAYLTMARETERCLLEVLESMSEEKVIPEGDCLVQLFRAVGTAKLRDDTAMDDIVKLGKAVIYEVSRSQVDGAYWQWTEKSSDSETVLTGIRELFDSSYEAPVRDEPPLYVCDLLQGLNSRDHSNLCPALTSDAGDFKSMLDRQLDLEIKGNMRMDSVLKLQKKDEKVDTTAFTDVLVEGWRESLEAALHHRLENQIELRSTLPGMTTSPFFKIVPVPDCIDIVLHELCSLLRTSETYGPSVSQVQNTLGLAVLAKIRIGKIMRQDYHRFLETYKEYAREWTRDPRSYAERGKGWCHREAYQELTKDIELP